MCTYASLAFWSMLCQWMCNTKALQKETLHRAHIRTQIIYNSYLIFIFSSERNYWFSRISKENAQRWNYNRISTSFLSDKMIFRVKYALLLTQHNLSIGSSWISMQIEFYLPFATYCIVRECSSVRLWPCVCARAGVPATTIPSDGLCIARYTHIPTHPFPVILIMSFIGNS